MRNRRSNDRRGEIRVHQPAAPRHQPRPPTPPAPAVLVGAALVGVAILVIGTVTSGPPPDESTPRPTIVEASDEDFADILTPSTTTTTTITRTVASEEISVPDEGAVLAVQTRRDHMVTTAADFLGAVGDGRMESAGVLLDHEAAPHVADLAGFFAEFRSGLRAAECRPLGSNAVSCDAFVTDEVLQRIGFGSLRGQVLVSFGSDGRVQSFDVPAVLGSASSRLASYMRDIDPETYERVCDPVISTNRLPTLGFAATAECGSALASIRRAFLATQ